jgi:predicted CXXCH cytochrome family protein
MLPIFVASLMLASGCRDATRKPGTFRPPATTASRPPQSYPALDSGLPADGPQDSRLPELSLPVVPDSPFTNTQPHVAYVGSASCRTCHPTESDSYDQTYHSRAMAASCRDLPPATVSHPDSGYEYDTALVDGRLTHTEHLHDQTCPPRTFAIDWVVGSGQFGHSFLTRRDGILIQSPLTWYTPRDCWDMSPGYDRPDHHAFRRSVSARCLFCHAGRTEQPDGNEYHVNVIEPAIGCERCHGPGELHVAKHSAVEPSARNANISAAQPAAAETDYSIVHPGRLSRELSEAVCEQCHLQGDAQVLVRGRKFDDFRPGLPLQLFRQEYREARETGMTIVGHVEQMRASLCYSKTDTLSCITCHDPHSQATPGEQRQSYRNVCVSCHQPEACRETPAARQERSDQCIDCHMPKSPTEVPHVAFTHHRIGVHRVSETPAAPGDTVQQMVSLTSEAGLPAADLARGTGLAWLKVALTATSVNSPQALQQARDLLQQAWNEGARDAAVADGLAKIAMEIGWREKADEWTAEVLRRDSLPTEERMSSLAIQSELQFDRGEYSQALIGFEELTAARRDARHWLYRGMSEQNLDRTADAIRSVQQSLAINPDNPGAHSALSVLFQLTGDTNASAEHRRLAEQQIQSARSRRQGP